MRLFNAELRKLRTVRTTWVLTIIGAAFVLLLASLTLFLDPMTMAAADFGGTDLEIAAIMDQIGQASVFVLVVAILAMTTEFRHGTIGRTLQITPSRTRVLLGKFAASSVYAILFWVATLVVVAVLLLIAAGSAGVSLDLGSQVTQQLWQGPLALLLTAVFGVALGALIRNQVVAITVTLVWFMMLESLIGWQAPAVGRYLPFTAMTSVFMSPETLQNVPEGMVQPLEPMTALLVFLAYVVAASAGALALLRYRDV